MNSDITTSTSRKDTSACFKTPLSARTLQRENRAFQGTGGISQENRQMGFRPAFYDAATNCVYPSRYADGRPAPCHLLDGLPEEVIIKRDLNGHVATVKSNLVAGFIHDGLFYSREQATQLMVNQYKRARVLTQLGQALEMSRNFGFEVPFTELFKTLENWARAKLNKTEFGKFFTK